jgi:hypothetical protein
LLLTYVVPAKPFAWARGLVGRIPTAVGFALALCSWAGVQPAVGFVEERDGWGAVPLGIDTYKARLFELDDSQIARDAAFAIGRFVPDPTLAPGYVERYSGQIVGLQAYTTFRAV